MPPTGRAVASRVFVASILLALGAPLGWAQSTFEILHAFEEVPSNPQGSVILGADGSLYGVSGSQGGFIFRTNTDGSGFTKILDLGSFGTRLGSLIQGMDGALFGTVASGGSIGGGAVFKVNTDGSGFTEIHAFGMMDPEPREPQAGLIQGTDGALYGTTAFSGPSGGVVFKLNTDGSGFAELHNFSGADGTEPHAGVVQGLDGALYGTTSSGWGTFGAVFKLNTDGSGFTKLVDFDGGTGARPESSLIQGSDGVLYGTTSLGGNNFQGVVFKINTDGSGFTKLLDFDRMNGADPVSSLVQGLDGALYGTASSGGANDSGVVFKVATDGSGFTRLLDFDGSNGGSPQSALVQGPNGTLYGATLSAGVLFKLHTDGSGFAELHRLDWTAEGAQPQAGPVLGTDGALYGTTWFGGGVNRGLVYRIASDGSGFAKLLDFNGANGSNSEAALIQGVDGALYGTTYYGGSSDQGVGFKIGVDGSGFTKLADFDGENGAWPAAGLVQGTDGALYGSAHGGVNWEGVVFRMNADGSGAASLHDFQWPGDGALPAGGVIQGVDGALYGVAQAGGASNDGALFKINTDGSGFSKLFDFDRANGVNPLRLIQGSDGVLYGTAPYGGSGDSGVAFRINTDGTAFSKLSDFNRTTGTNPLGLIQGSDGALYGTTLTGGANGVGVVFRVDTDGSHFAKLLEFDGLNGASPMGLVEGSDGALYGAASSGGPRGGGVVFRVLPQTLSTDNVSIAEGDSGTSTATFTVSMTPPAIQPVTVDYSTADGTATAGSDYVATSGTLTFDPGDTTKTIDVLVNGDTAYEPDETFFLKLSTPVNATIVAGQGTGTIQNDDPPPSISINDVSLTEGDKGIKNAVFTVGLSAVSGLAASVGYATADGTATAGSDYTAVSGTLTIPAGNPTGTISVPIIGDTVHETDETFFVNLSAPSDATILDGQGQGTILNDDPPATIGFGARYFRVSEGAGHATIWVVRSADLSQGVTVDYATADGTATAPGDYSATSGTLTFLPWETRRAFTIPIVKDSVFEGDETVLLQLGNPGPPSAGAVLGAWNTAVLTIVDANKGGAPSPRLLQKPSPKR